jgi:penicillin-binding protein 2
VQPTRFYPHGSAAAHILGYLRADNRSMEGEVADFNFRLPDYRGHTGLEHDYDQELRGKAGVKSVLVNSLGYRQSENVWNPAEPGRNLVLTLDLTIQQAAETNLQRAMPQTRGAVVVMDPNNGDILALASSPSFDPNWFIPNISFAAWHWMNDPVLKPQVNRAMQENYAPGSIFKILTGISALENGLTRTRSSRTRAISGCPDAHRSSKTWRIRVNTIFARRLSTPATPISSPMACATGALKASSG